MPAHQETQHIELWPIELVAAEYFSFAPDLPLTALPVAKRIKGGVRLRLRTTAGLQFNQIALTELRFFLSGSDEVAYKLHELCLGAAIGVLVAPAVRPWPWHDYVDGRNIKPVGYQDDQALLPATLRSFQGTGWCRSISRFRSVSCLSTCTD